MGEIGEATATGADIFLLVPKNPKIECLIDLDESLDFELRIDGDDSLVHVWSLRCFLWPTVSRVGSVHETSNIVLKICLVASWFCKRKEGKYP